MSSSRPRHILKRDLYDVSITVSLGRLTRNTCAIRWSSTLTNTLLSFITRRSEVGFIKSGVHFLECNARVV
jgi:hypothetical protein